MAVEAIGGDSDGDGTDWIQEPRDWIDRFSRHFFPSTHRHLGDDDHGHSHDDHGHSHDDHGHSHDDHGHSHDDHDHSAEHEDEVHASESNHTEFRAEYALTCANIGAIDALAFPYFERFENAREIELQVAGPDGAGAYEVTSGNPGLDLGGMF